MEFLKKLLKEDDEKMVGLCGFKKKTQRTKTIIPDFSAKNLVFYTNTKNNFLLLVWWKSTARFSTEMHLLLGKVSS